MTLRRFRCSKYHARLLLAIAATLATPACRATLRVAPSVTVDTHGKAGFQALVGLGFMATGKGEDAKGLALGALGGAAANVGDPRGTAIVESAIDYYLVPNSESRPRAVPALGSPSPEPTSPTDSGPVARAGGRIGFRTAESGPVRLAVGAAGAVAWRIGSTFWHFIGVEGRADYVDSPSGYGVFAIGPHYELASPALESFGGR